MFSGRKATVCPSKETRHGIEGAMVLTLGQFHPPSPMVLCIGKWAGKKETNADQQLINSYTVVVFNVVWSGSRTVV